MAVQVVAVQAKRQPVTESLSLVGSIAANEMVRSRPTDLKLTVPANEGYAGEVKTGQTVRIG